ncbi:MAG TPA: hypothetical protein VNK04_07250 [Gemmataceae bacterium]|nr:hypothetical protein [Gemmataceae bacterium]
MSYAVDWDDDALFTLAAIWIGASDRQAVTVAQATIDRVLASNPVGNGTPVGEGLYAFEVPPLRVLFEVCDPIRSVRVVSVGELV